MDNNILDIDGDKNQSLSAWVNEIMMPVLETISFVTMELELQLHEIN
ncbi:hypothetical protein LCGC14_2862500 [marine sediment metagenome]|uniref:Uncharacterized protein n=1 Tax=marine sediment metagenome TaxID=412755 RepID=A0A0F9ADK5_9ZZZZ